MSTIFINSFVFGGGARSYATILQEDFGASEVWPLVNIASGTTIPAFVDSARNGTLLGWDLQNAAGPVPGTLAPYNDGANDYGNVYTSNGSTGFVDIFDGEVGSCFTWAKIANSGVWTDATYDEIIDWRGTGSNFIVIQKTNSNNQIIFYHVAGGTVKSVTLNSVTTTAWFSIGSSWDLGAGASGEFRAYLNGAQVGTTQTSLGTWAGAIATNRALIGAETITPANVWNGHLAYKACIFGSAWTPQQFADMHAAAATAGPD